jgi:foldase protein PrsA
VELGRAALLDRRDDETTRENEARMPGVPRGTLERPLSRAVFAARPGRVVGPVRTQFGYYVFRVTRIHPAFDMPIEEAREQARFQLLSEKQQEGHDAFVTEFRAKWRARTACAPRWRSQRECGAPE